MAREAAAPAGGAVELDELDRAIVAHLQEDGRRPYRQIADELGVPEATVRFRTRRLMQDGVLTIQATANPFRLGYEVVALVLMRTVPSRRPAVVEELARWAEVVYISSCAGRADLAMQVICRNHHDLYLLLSERLAALDGVSEAETLMELEVHKFKYAFPNLAAR